VFHIRKLANLFPSLSPAILTENFRVFSEFPFAISGMVL